MNNTVQSVNKYKNISKSLIMINNASVLVTKYSITTTYDFYNGERIVLELSGTQYKGKLVKNKNRKYFIFDSAPSAGLFNANQLILFDVSWNNKSDDEFITLADINKESINPALDNEFDINNVLNHYGNSRLIHGNEYDKIRKLPTISYNSGLKAANTWQTNIAVFDIPKNLLNNASNQSIGDTVIDLLFIIPNQAKLFFKLKLDLFEQTGNEIRYQLLNSEYTFNNKTSGNVRIKENDIITSFRIKTYDHNSVANRIIVSVDVNIELNSNVFNPVTYNLFVGTIDKINVSNSTSEANISTLKNLQYAANDWNFNNTEAFTDFVFTKSVVGYNNNGLINNLLRTGATYRNPIVILPTTNFDFNADRNFGAYQVYSSTVTNIPTGLDVTKYFLLEEINLRKTEDFSSQTTKIKIQKVYGFYSDSKPFVAYRRVTQNSGSFDASNWLIVGANTGPTTISADNVIETATRKFITPEDLSFINIMKSTLFRPEPVNTIADLSLIVNPIVGYLVYVISEDAYYRYDVNSDWIPLTNNQAASWTTSGIVHPNLYVEFRGASKSVSIDYPEAFIHQAMDASTVLGQNYQMAAPKMLHISTTPQNTLLQSKIQENSVTFGFSNLNLEGSNSSSQNSVVIGTSNQIDVGRGILIGVQNHLEYSTTTSYQSILVGTDNRAYFDNSILIGTQLESVEDDQIILGKYNNLTESSNKLFIIGDGDGVNPDPALAHRNVFEITKTGHVRIPSNGGIQLMSGGTNTQVYATNGTIVDLTNLPSTGVQTLVEFKQVLGWMYLYYIKNGVTENVRFKITDLFKTDYAPQIGGAINGSNTQFTVAQTFIGGTLKVYKSGIRLTPGPLFDYVENNSLNGFTMNVAPVAGTIFVAEYVPNTV